MQLKPVFPSEVRSKTSILVIAKSIWAKDIVRASLLLILVLNVAFFPCILGNRTFLESARDTTSILPKGSWAGRGVPVRYHKTLDPGASGWQTEPSFQLIRHQYLSEHVTPLWNPNQGFGVPLAADMISQPFSPFTLLLLPRLTPRTYNIYILTRLFVAGLFGYLFLSYFVSFLPSVCCGLISMLSGYYVLFVNMPHLSVEVMLPACFWAAERLLRRRNITAALLFSLILAAEILGGMPESTLLAFAFTGIYAAFRILSDGCLRSKLLRLTSLVFVGFAAALGLCAFLIFPFYEYMKISWNAHEARHTGGAIVGLMHDRFDYSVVNYLFPMVLGPLYTHPESYNPEGYWGIAAFFLSLVAIASAAAKKLKNPGQLFALTCFFAFSAALIFLKRFGLPPVQSIGNLPFFSLVLFPKYQEVLLGFCVAVLAGIGVHCLSLRILSRKSVNTLLVLLLMGVAAVAISFRHLFQHQLDETMIPDGYPFVSLAVPAVTLLTIVVILWLQDHIWKSVEKQRFVKLSFYLAIAFELSANFIIPNYLIFDRAPRAEDNPYVGAPFVKVLQKETSDHSRLFGRDLVLTPSWASAFNLQDIRALDALFYKKYFPFLYNFFPDHAAMAPDLQDRFYGAGPYQFDSPLQRRLLQLSSVKYLTTVRSYPYPDLMLDELWRQNDGHFASGHEAQISKREVAIDGVSRQSIFEHPPYNRLPYRLTVPKMGDDTFHFSYALHPDAFNMKAGDGIGFAVELKERSGKIRKLFSSYIDPKHNVNQRHWINASVNLGEYRNQTVDLLFSTDPGPKKDTSYDWAVWSNFDLQNAVNKATRPFVPIYAGEADVYRYDDVLPRAAIFYAADVVQGEDQVLKHLRDPGIDIFHKLVLNATDLTNEQLRYVNSLNQFPGKRVAAATILDYRSNSVTIKANSDSNSILMLNDSDYPGWFVDVDGKHGNWFTANYMFRAVALQPGTHTVHFTYNPSSFRSGVLVTLSTVAALFCMYIFDLRARKEATGKPQ